MSHSRSWRFLGLGVLAVILILSLVLIWEFVDVIVISLSVAYIAYPIARWLNGKKTDKTMTYLIASLGAVLIIAVPIILSLLYGLNYLMHWIIQNLPSVHSGQFTVELKAGLSNMGFGILSERIASEIGKILLKFSSSIAEGLIKPTWLAEILLKIALFFVTTFYFVYEGPHIKKFLDKNVPNHERFLQELFTSFDRICYGLFVGHFFTSVIIALLFAAGYWLIFMPGVLALSLLTVLMFIIAFLPVIGPWSMYIPLAIWHMAFVPDGATKGALLIGFGIVFLTLIPDFYIRPKIIRRGAEIHPLLIILGFFGGPLVMGLKGVIIGPLILGLAQAIVTLYIEKKHILKELVEHF